jgi:hypothetical protein
VTRVLFHLPSPQSGGLTPVVYQQLLFQHIRNHIRWRFLCPQPRNAVYRSDKRRIWHARKERTLNINIRVKMNPFVATVYLWCNVRDGQFGTVSVTSDHTGRGVYVMHKGQKNLVTSCGSLHRGSHIFQTIGSQVAVSLTRRARFTARKIHGTHSC